ncbi:MAG: hypothetical protein IJT57_05500, partial [Selenomonadaceae bacterium]|nr:hypothetical protein [Selenomonadaceae bacterium]
MFRDEIIFSLQRFSYITNDMDYAMVNGTSEDDTIYNTGGGGCRIYGYAGNDSIYSKYRATVDGGAGNDTIQVNAGSLFGGAGNDIITLSDEASGITICGGTGNDTIYAGSTNTTGRLFEYQSGDGNDIVSGFTSNDTLSISGGNYSTQKSGLDIIVTVDNGKISLMGSA